MRFNKQELITISTQPSTKFEKEGILYVREKQDGFFRKSERKDSKGHKKGDRKLRNLSCVGGVLKANLERWCRLRGNLLFYLKTKDPWSEPVGVLVLEQCQVRLEPPFSTSAMCPSDYHTFYLVFDGGLCQALAATSVAERTSWIEAVRSASYEGIRAEMLALKQCLSRRQQYPNHQQLQQQHYNVVATMDLATWRLQRNHTLDLMEVPICELSLACDNLLCDGQGTSPNPCLVLDVLHVPSANQCRFWVQYATTEVVERCSNPTFFTTITLYASDAITATSRIRFTVYDVRERFSHTCVPLGGATVQVAALLHYQHSHGTTARLRIPLYSRVQTTVGFLTVSTWTVEMEGRNTAGGVGTIGCGTGGGVCNSSEHTPSKLPLSSCSTAINTQVWCHRRSQSLPPRLAAKIMLPNQAALKLLFTAPHIQTYRFHSGLGGDIFVHELMAESRLCFSFSQQLLSVWIQQEKELLQEVAAMGELRAPWHCRQVELLDRHLHLLRLYSQARENLQAHRGPSFKQSARKFDRSLEFVPVNMHLQRMWAYNDTLKKSASHDWITVGAFTAHAHKANTGGLIRLVQQLKLKNAPPPTNNNNNDNNNSTVINHQQITTKITIASDAIQAIKQLRKDIVDDMKQLMHLARVKETAGMLPLCESLIAKTRSLLTLWDPGLVEEALRFIDEHKVAALSDDDDTTADATVETDEVDGLNGASSPFKRITQQLTTLDLKSPDLDDFATPCSPQNVIDLWAKRSGQQQQKQCLLNTSEGVRSLCSKMAHSDSTNNFVLFPECEQNNVEDEIQNHSISNGGTVTVVNGSQSEGRTFLDTTAMCSSPSANYYKPSDEPEPWDITQLNIEASVMCLVSKVKFLCGRCGSPAVRLRHTPRGGVRTILSTDASQTAFGNYKLTTTTTTNNGAAVKVRNGNKFTDGLDLSKISDWAGELRPSMRKLRQAMDGLLKTARLTHSVFRVQEEPKAAQRVCNVRYRRDVCFSQALTALTVGLMTRLWCTQPDASFLNLLSSGLGPLAYFEGLLTYYLEEVDMWGDMSVAIEDLRTVQFRLVRTQSPSVAEPWPAPKVEGGSRQALRIDLPVPDHHYVMVPALARRGVTFHVTPVFFNVGINEMATVAGHLGVTRPQDRANIDNFDRLNEYYLRHRKLPIGGADQLSATVLTVAANASANCSYLEPYVGELLARLRHYVHNDQVMKNTQVLHLVAQICRHLKGIRFTSCMSAKDRTGMAVTLEQCQILKDEYHLAESDFQRALDCMRSEGCRRHNTLKNINVRKYNFHAIQVLALPPLYRPPAGTYGSGQK